MTTATIWNRHGSPVVSCRKLDVPDYGSSYFTDFVSIQRLPTEPVGTFTLTLTNVVVGSAIQIETQDGATVYENRTAAAGTYVTEAFTLSAYSAGSTKNDLRIKVRKGSAATYYKPWETLATAIVGANSIYVAQVPDQ